MTPEQLKRILEIANKGGYKYYLSVDVTGFTLGNCIRFWQRKFVHINEIIFDPEFGKAYWGEEWVCKTCMKERKFDADHYTFVCGCNEPYPDKDEINAVLIYKYHQSKLGGMSDAERKECLVRDLEGRK